MNDHKCTVCQGEPGEVEDCVWCDGQGCETDGTNNIVCPHCGDEFGDSWEIPQDSGTEECQSCGKSYTFERIVEVTYKTVRA
ncbi:hypothetical protein [Tumebacillus flagellatus]|uniref:Uncharacterized protein n=1 Tax=Tumebacillus flagellatus TaxID=1157490 RepID=A0A074LF28_9BACL|nr:hypothetical protein [Tumebacillus flagellatus]KEO80851.1 hypothetical protein EL26_24020 [Tumebacillus flagellatus]